MAAPPIPLTCEERSGFLFAHGCDRPPVDQCAACGKWVCTEHIRQLGNRFLCVTCHRAQTGTPAPQQTSTQQRGYYDYDDDWFDYRWQHWHDYTYYDSDDRDVFRGSDQMASGGGFGAEGHASGGGFGSDFESDFDAS